MAGAQADMVLKSGIDLTHVDPAFAPGDDLYRHLNGGWLKSHQIPADRASDGVAYALHDEAEAQVRQIIESASATAGDNGDAQKIGDLYRSFMNTEAIEKLGVSPLATDLAAIDAISSVSDFISTMSILEMKGVGGIFGASIYTDAMDSDTNIIYLSQGGLSLPDESYYREEQYAPIREAFVDHVVKMFGLAGITVSTSEATSILALETSIAACHWDQVRDRDATLTYNKHTRAELEKLAPALDFPLWLKSGEVPAKAFETVIVREPDFFSGVSSLLEKFDRDVWVLWLKWQLISGSAPYLNDAIVQQNFAFYGTTLSGTPQIRERWKRAVSLVEGSLGEAVGRIYVERHFPPAAKAAMNELVANLIEAYRISISELSWMSEATKAKAFEKLTKFTPKIGYPDKWRDYSSLAISADDLFGNLGRISAFARNYELAKIGAPVDRSEWYMTPQTVNAYYNPGMNEIVFPAAILQPPFFDIQADPAVNYGGIGAVIGHEIGHGFDDQGSKYDGDGNMVDWWTQSDRDEFEIRANALIAQFDALSPEETPDITVNGALTVGENIGDLGGLSIAYKAYLLALKGAKAPVIDGLTGEQRFFLAWAQAWRGKVRPEELRRRIATDPHSPYEFRCNAIVRNIDEFYTAFDVSESNKLWMKSSERVRIW
jgi:putative endopeptidase